MNNRLRSLYLPLSLIALTILSLPSVFAQKEASAPTKVWDSANWKKLNEAYSYDSQKSPTITADVKENPAEYVEHIEFKGLSGERVTGLFVRPKKEGAYPLIIMLHGWTSNKDDMDKFIGPELIKQGFAFFSLDAPEHGERTLDWMVEMYAWHSRHHTAHITELRTHKGW